MNALLWCVLHASRCKLRWVLQGCGGGVLLWCVLCTRCLWWGATAVRVAGLWWCVVHTLVLSGLCHR